MENTNIETLADVMPRDFLMYDNLRSWKYKDVRVVQKFSLCEDEENWKPWPGGEKNVYFWVILENGKAVAWNENPTARGWGFPVISMKNK